VIVLDVEQGSPEWLQARLTIPTASMFKNIITPTGKASTGEGYLKQLCSEWLIGQPDPDGFAGNYWTDRGTRLEPEARALYTFLTDNEVTQVGLCYKDAMRRYSASPDGLVGEDGGWECKCPKLETHQDYLIDGGFPIAYKPQVQGCMWITGRKHWDFMSYHPLTEPLIVRVHRDETYIKNLEKFMGLFLAKLKLMKDKVESYKL
jgi:hypothetical protein